MEILASAVSSCDPLTVHICGDHDAVAWDQFVGEHPGASGYHAWSWRHVFARAFRHESIYFAVRRDSDIVGVLPLVFINSFLFGRSLTSLPFLNYGGVVADSYDVAQALLDAASAAACERRCGHVELRHVERRFASLPCKQHKVSMHLPLQTGLWDLLDRKVRNQIRKAQKSGLSVESGGIELLADFYSVFARNMRDLGTPVYSRRFFAEALGAFPERARIHVVRLGAAPVAAAITHRFRSTVEVPWASSIREYNSLCPNHLLYWGIIERAIETGATVLDFGRSTPHEGTYKFKEQWGAHPVPLHWEYPALKGGQLPDVNPSNPKFQLAVRMWKKLPLSIATRVGPSIVRAIP